MGGKSCNITSIWLMTHPKWKNSICYILWKFYTSKVLYICCYLGWHVCRGWQNKFSVGMNELQTKPQNFQAIPAAALKRKEKERKKEMPLGWAMCEAEALWFLRTIQWHWLSFYRGVFLQRATEHFHVRNRPGRRMHTEPNTAAKTGQASQGSDVWFWKYLPLQRFKQRMRQEMYWHTPLQGYQSLLFCHCPICSRFAYHAQGFIDFNMVMMTLWETREFYILSLYFVNLHFQKIFSPWICALFF